MNDNLLPLLNKAYFFLKFRPRTEKEIRDYLYKKIKTKHWSRDDVEIVIEKLKEKDFINDERFIELFVRDRTMLKPKGKRLLIKELKLKGIKDELIDNFFLKNEVDEEKLAFQILSKRWPRFKSLDSKKQYEKSVRFLLSRGFSYDIVKKTIEKII